ncbi:hypothetical protein F4808DRAFT_472705 [Astrocystis sublimbata]|nr:hypothetical protein F4808DRAFT_472705 [Astrocystis sublimbata]
MASPSLGISTDWESIDCDASSVISLSDDDESWEVTSLSSDDDSDNVPDVDRLTTEPLRSHPNRSEESTRIATQPVSQNVEPNTTRAVEEHSIRKPQVIKSNHHEAQLVIPGDHGVQSERNAMNDTHNLCIANITTLVKLSGRILSQFGSERLPYEVTCMLTYLHEELRLWMVLGSIDSTHSRLPVTFLCRAKELTRELISVQSVLRSQAAQGSRTPLPEWGLDKIREIYDQMAEITQGLGYPTSDDNMLLKEVIDHMFQERTKMKRDPRRLNAELDLCQVTMDMLREINKTLASVFDTNNDKKA